MSIAQILTLLAGTVLGCVVALLGVWWAVRRQIGRVQTALRAGHEEGAAVELGGGYSTDEVEAEPARRCDGCVNWSHSGGQQLLNAHPAFKQAVMARPLWQMGMGPKRRAFLDLEHEIFNLTKELEGLAASERAASETKLEDLRARLKLEPEYDDAASHGLAKNMEVGVEDFGACAVLGELRSRGDGCPKWRARA